MIRCDIAGACFRVLLWLLFLGLTIGSGHGESRTGTGTLLAVNKSQNSLSVIDLEEGKAATEIAVGRGPHEVAVSPNGRLALVTNYGSTGAPGNTLSVVIIVSAETYTINLGEHTRPHGVVWLSDNRHVLVTTEGSGSLLKVNVETSEIVQVIPVNREVSHMVALAPGEQRAYVTSIGAGSISMIDLQAGKTVHTAAVGQGAEGLAVTPDGREVWVTNREEDTVAVLDGNTLEELARLPVEGFPIRIAISANGALGIVTTAKGGHALLIDIPAREILADVSMRGAYDMDRGRMLGGLLGFMPIPVSVVFHPHDTLAYVANTFAGYIAVIDLGSGERVAVLRAGREPDGLAYSPVQVPYLAER